MIIDEDHIYSMLITEPFYKTFITKEIADTSKTSEVILSLSASDREEVDTLNVAFAKKSKCPFSHMVSGLNKIADALSVDKKPSIMQKVS